MAAGAGAGAGVAAGLVAGALAGAALVAGAAAVASADFFDELFLAGAGAAVSAVSSDFLDLLFVAAVAVLLSAASAEAASAVFADFFALLFFVVLAVLLSAATVSVASADFLDLLFLVVVAVPLSAAALSVAVLLFFEVLFLAGVESLAAALSAAVDFFLEFDLAVFVESALASALLWAESAAVAFLVFFLVVVAVSPVSEVLDCCALPLLTLPQTSSSAAITARNNPLLNFMEFSPSAFGCLEDLTHSFASCRGGLERLQACPAGFPWWNARIIPKKLGEVKVIGKRVWRARTGEGKLEHTANELLAFQRHRGFRASREESRRSVAGGHGAWSFHGFGKSTPHGTQGERRHFAFGRD